MITSFKDLGISPPILQAVEEMGYISPTEVQNQAIPHIINSPTTQQDLIVMSKTGSGKTAVFGIPMLQLIDPKTAGPQGLILTPARELAVQVDSDIKNLSRHLEHRTIAVYGQHNINTEKDELKKGAAIVTGTPGRVFDHISQGTLKTKNIRFFVLDEADRMLDMGFIDQVVKIIRTLPKDRVTLLFSATMPEEIRRICRDYMRNPMVVEIGSQTKTVDTIRQVYYRVNGNEKNTQLGRLLLMEQPESCMIFCNTKAAVDRVQSSLTRKGYYACSLHGDIPQATRLKTIDQFKEGVFHILVATDVAARGIHIEGLSLVINYDVPNDRDSYVHRIGRTGRAGNDGRAISLVTSEDIMSLYEIEEHIGALIEEGELPTDAAVAECSSKAGPWLEANAFKGKLPRVSGQNSGTKSSQRKSPSREPHAKTPRTAKSNAAAQPKAGPRKQRADGAKASGAEKAGKAGRTTDAAAIGIIGTSATNTGRTVHSSKPAARPAAANANKAPATPHKKTAVTNANTIVRQVRRQTADADTAPREVVSKMPQGSIPAGESNVPARKKPLLQRILHGLFGK